MKKRKSLKLFSIVNFILIFILPLSSCKGSYDKGSGNHYSFNEIDISLEYLADKDTIKGHFIVKSGFNLGDLVVENPNEDVILDFFSDEISVYPNFIAFSTAEKTYSDFKESYPVGEYKIYSSRATGVYTQGISKLTYDFPDAPEILFPESGYLIKGDENLFICWKRMNSSAGYILRIFKHAKLIYYAKLNEDLNHITISNKYFDTDTEYNIRLSAVNKNGNFSTSSVTVKRKA